ncbi:hypothetical protein O1611_g3549 [Lasiodiplodia mahajangana]|uniref:Uncharacterized protein n=1 Tax=Lasiodiplodia mahajangana TaxID=1108764 RepID=A0ACC2JRU9_9PEZI|nr:hypothetical protein O1611_g3549 [Lasiodiplodia mahajangana]
MPSSFPDWQMPWITGMSDPQHPQPGTPRTPDAEPVSNMNLDGASDRPRGSAAGSHRGPPPGGSSGYTVKPLGYDPGREEKEELRDVDIIGKRVDLPAEAYLKDNTASQFTSRPGFNTQGKPIQVQLNIFPIIGFETRDIYQYDVSISPEPKNLGPLAKKLWYSAPAQKIMANTGGKWLFDGFKLAWSSKPIDRNEFRVSIDLDADRPNRRRVANSGAKKLMINIDTANTTFWQTKTVAEIGLRMFNEHNEQWSNWGYIEWAEQLRPVPVKDRQGRTEPGRSEAFSLLRRLQKLKFVVKHRGKMHEEKQYVIKDIKFDKSYGREGANSQNVHFDKKMPDGSVRSTTVFQHYQDTYGFRLQYPRLPLIETTRSGMFPMELCNVADFQRYPFKLDPAQTAAMIKFAVTRPEKRKADIMQGFQKLNYTNDPYLAEFGIKVSGNMQITNARLLRNPEVAFGGNAKIDPGVSGRWDLRGKRFLEPNQKPITSWGLVVCGNSCTKQEAEAFASKFAQTYRNHGGNYKVNIHVIQVPFSIGDYGEICLQAWNKIGNHFKLFPELIFFVLPNKNSLVYERIKKSMDCRFCIPSQVLQGGQVKKANAQYMSNVAMKVNAKLGGITCKVAAGPTNPFFQCPTMIMGVDVSHAAPGSAAPSLAAMSVSLDKNATRYAGACEANGSRQEILQSTAFHSMFPRILRHWISIHKTAPQHVYYLRDGVSEGQFAAVLDLELREIRRVFRELNAGTPKITVIIATKRHHIRFFPKPHDKTTGDRNGNPLPGTLVERDATHPHHFDFYLCSHVAIQGTARPVHYQVIYDEANVKPDNLQAMIYQQCYQYARSTTPVSLHPAVYYAHLISNRARAHEDIHASQREIVGGKEGHPSAKHPSDVHTEQSKSTEPPPLLAMNNSNLPRERVVFMNTTMWYI